ncbi:hypothetical protein B0920_04395 [Massilia sp. KIM]|uniref:DUF4124 domain-containing protein n=1 Tax=Massilia sp. KIM TaxID=1955422 RepID=UPI00098F99A1|nr:DUF4124 domain-containing protein [Massilia sp. KIM]OON62688.1 hypothetical protein B0920_04395 [Massilia sp. KIM]
MSQRIVIAALLSLLAASAHAQYVWIDANGTRQYSDRPPPPGTPQSRILKTPGRQALAPQRQQPAPEPAQAAPAPKASPTLAEQESAYKERVKQRAEQEQKEAAEAARKRDVAARCEAARETQAQMASGIRIARVGQDGQRSYMTDEEKAARAAQASKVLSECR